MITSPPLPDSVILQKFAGIRNTVTAERLAPDELERAVNVDIDDAGQIHRRRGWTRVVGGDFASLFTAANGTVYGVKNGQLGVINPNYSFVTLRAGVGPAPLAYVQVGPEVYFSSLTDSGVILPNGSIALWGAEVSAGVWLSPVVNPTSTLAQVRGKLLGKPPMATALACSNGRIYLANKRTLWATELYLYNYVDKTKNFLFFEDDITVLGGVTDGLYVGTKSAVWFLSGAFNEMRRIAVMSAGAIPGSLVYLPAELVNPQLTLDQSAPSKNAVLFLTDSGLVAGLDGGNLFNFTETDVIFPEAQSAAAMFRQQDGVNQYVSVLASGGTPADTARIGDYVDAEIRRGGNWEALVDGVRIGETLIADVV